MLPQIVLISILAVLADRDRDFAGYAAAIRQFQSSRSLRTATWSYRATITPMIFQSSRSLRTATDYRYKPSQVTGISILAVLADRDTMRTVEKAGIEAISILAVLADRDPPAWWAACWAAFQSSRSLRTATAKTHKRSAASLYKAENILSAPKSFLREGRKNQRLPSPSPCVFRCEPARERPGAWPSH